MVAEYLAKETFVRPGTKMEEKFIKVGTIREELERLPGNRIESECIGFIEHLLVIDYLKRPTAKEALEHSWPRDMDS